MTPTQRIIKEWDNSTIEERISGENWYPSALSFSRSLGLGDMRGAGIVAALSPQASWDVNKKWALAFANNPNAAVSTGKLRNKARRILSANSEEEILSILNGPKIRRFFLNILGHREVATVDRWAIRIALGEDKAITSKQYDEIEREYQKAASKLGVPTSTVQATTWIHRRGSEK